MSASRAANIFLFPALLLLLAHVSMGAPQDMAGRVIDDNGLAVAGAKVTLSRTDLPAPIEVISDDVGRFRLRAVVAGTYHLKVEKIGYYAFVSTDFLVGDRTGVVEVVLNHQQEFGETVNVVYSAPVIDPHETAVQTTLTSAEIIDMPFPATHDFRNALPLIPGVIRDNRGRMHMGGGGENQAFYSLDGFNISSPVSGVLRNRISIDAIRAVRVESGRYSAEYGKGSAGVMALESSRGDDRFRFSATNFLPSFESHGGWAISNWNPRATFSGPIRKGRAWYYNALDLQYDLNIVDALPRTENKNQNWFGSDMTHLQMKLTGTNILSLGFLMNFQSSHHFGLTALDPLETSRNRSERFYFCSIRDQAYLSGGWVLETGVALNHLDMRERPRGDAPYLITPQGRSGNYFLRSLGKVGRYQGVATLVTPYWNWHGRHSFKIGADANRNRYRQSASRQTIEIRRLQGTRSRLVEFWGNPFFERDSAEFGAFAQDRWSLGDRLFIEAGARFDWDQILREPMVSPRFAVTLSPRGMPDSKFSAGIGLFYDAVNLALLTRELDQQRSDTFYSEDGVTVLRGPLSSRYLANERNLRAPVYLSWSLGWEQKLPKSFYLRTNFMRKVGRHGWAYDYHEPMPEDASQMGTYQLENLRRDQYSYLEFTLTRRFKDKYPWLLSYARSNARSTAVLDFSQDNPVFGRQAAGPLDWNAPNRLISWALLPMPFPKKYTLAFFLEWHSGFPYTTVDDMQQLVGLPNSRRLPDYFSLNLHFERRFQFWRYQWALRAGFNNITDNRNPVVVNNNIDSPDFQQFSGGQGRVFTGRIRFLGKN